jgi:hypothetical protein
MLTRGGRKRLEDGGAHVSLGDFSFTLSLGGASQHMQRNNDTKTLSGFYRFLVRTRDHSLRVAIGHRQPPVLTAVNVG